MPVVSPLAHIVNHNSDVLFQLAPDPAHKYEKAGDLVGGDKHVTLIYTASTYMEFEREILALLGVSEYSRYSYKSEHPSARSANSPSDLTPLLENGQDNLFVILSDNSVDVERILAALDSGEYGAILRAKGILPAAEGQWLHFDYVPEEHEVRTGGAEYTGRLCVIGADLREDRLKALFGL